MKNQQIVGLDGVRFLTALLVAVYHLTAWHPLVAKPGTVVALAAPSWGGVFWTGWIGVEVFFVLSGFVIAYSASSGSALTFFRSRTLRLLPEVWICASLAFAASRLAGDGLPASSVGNLLKTFVIYPTGPHVDIVYWTLAVEVAFYGAVFLALISKRISLDALAILLALWSGGANLAMLGADHLVSWGPALVDYLHSRATFTITLIHHGTFFALGMTIWAAWRYGLSGSRIFVMALSTAGGAAEIVLHVTHHPQFGSYPVWQPLAAWILFVTAIVLSLRYNEAISQVLGTSGVRAFRFLGLMTFPLYLLHYSFGMSVMEILRNAGMEPGPAYWASWIVIAVATIAVTRWVGPWLRNVLAVQFDAATAKARAWSRVAQPVE